MNFSDPFDKTSNPFDKISEIQNVQLEQTQESSQSVRREVMQSIQEKPFLISRRGPLLAVAVGIAIALLGATYLLLRPEKNKPVAKESMPSQWIVASATQFETKTFADNSQIVLSPTASARVIQAAPSTVRVLLEKGKADVSVIHTDKTNWLLEAGPYTVAVTGTRFEISWDTQKRFFTLMLIEGTVVVTGPMIEEGKSMETGEKITAWVTEKRMELSTPDSSVEVASQVKNDTKENPNNHTSAVPADVTRESKRKSKAANKNHPPDADAIASSWRQLCRKGKFESVVEQATQRGLHTSIQQGSLDDLMALGEAARLTRKRMVANQAYQQVRYRFSGTPQSASAAFYLGKIAFDQHRSYPMAARWLTIYLQENQSGPYAKDALGRLMEAQEKSGSISQAKTTARQYLGRYPQGTHAALAKEILEK